MSHHILLSLCALTFAGAAVGQSGRTMRVNAPAVIGQTARFAMQHPVAAAGNLYMLVWSPPFAGAVPLSVPGLTVNGLVRVDLANAVSVVSGVLASTGMTPDLQLPIPNDPLIVGYAWDLQGVDLSAANVLALADDDLEIVVSSPPLPAANLVLIGPGSFPMGSSEPVGLPPYYNQAEAQPVHTVSITRPFWIGKCEVTQSDYQSVVGSNPSFFVGANRPVEQVSWSEAMTYCTGLTAREAGAGRLPSGYQYRLPTEAEWEYCCRAGTTTEFQYGPSLVCGQATFSYSFHSNSGCNSIATAVVGGYTPNAWGLFDMHGNVWEWCLDAWDGSASFPSSSVSDPFESGSSSGPNRIYRGGNFYSPSSFSRSADRRRALPHGQSYGLGFRVVLAPILTP